MGHNSYASKPCGDGLSFYFSLWVELTSALNPDTGFVVNVSEIDKVVRQQALPLFQRTVTAAMRSQRSLGLADLVSLLKQCFAVIDAAFDVPRLTGLGLELNPFRKLFIQAENHGMFTYSEKFEFAAMHRLWNDRFDEARNIEFFGKCANPAGHGHNYVLEVSVGRQRDAESNGWICEFEKVVETQFLDLVDHKNLNVDVAGFETLNPTVENLAYFAWEKLDGQFKNSHLEKITVWENDRTFCSYTRPPAS